MKKLTDEEKRNYLRFASFASGAAIISYIAIVLGGIVRASGAAGACVGWPVCGGSWLPVFEGNILADYGHRSAAFLLGPALVFLTVISVKKGLFRSFIGTILVVSLAVIAIQGVQGIAVAETEAANRPVLTAVHLGFSLLIQALTLILTVVSFYKANQDSQPVFEKDDTTRKQWILRFRSPFSRLTLIVIGATFLLLVNGAVVSAVGASEACTSWPLCGNGLLPVGVNQWIAMSHRVIVLLTGILYALQLRSAWKTQRTQTGILASATTASVLFFAQALMGWFKVSQNFPDYMTALHEATSVAVWSAIIVQFAAVGMAKRSREDELIDAASIYGRKGLAKDLLILTKPIVVLLLLVTTFTGMVIGAQEWPQASLVFWTLLGGAMAAGGSGAINQYIDRHDDEKMQRTSRRPIPSGRLTPGEGLAFGIALCLVSFYLLVAFVNLLAALLSLAGIIYYVLLYSILLKKTTVQNIVIGGGAGAIPPLVGWAAATGSLNIPSLFLFAVIFMWTPPHFWALAIVRKNDYARAGVPMLPVIRGEKEARYQILIYTIELVVLTLLLPLFGLGESIYLISAVALGGWLLSAAVRVWRQEGNKVAWKMYRYSSMYLAFLFLALMVDRLILK